MNPNKSSQTGREGLASEVSPRHTSMAAWTISGLMVARLAKEHIDPDSERSVGSTSARSDSDSEPAAEPSRRLYDGPLGTVTGGDEDAARPTVVDGQVIEPLKSVIEPMPPNADRTYRAHSPSPTTILEKLGAMYEEMLAGDNTTPLSQTGKTEGNFLASNEWSVSGVGFDAGERIF